MNRIEESRRRVEARLADVRDSIERELGFAPRALGALLSLAAFSVGLVAARKLFSGLGPEAEPPALSSQPSKDA
jgi:hypothetical protein